MKSLQKQVLLVLISLLLLEFFICFFFLLKAYSGLYLLELSSSSRSLVPLLEGSITIIIFLLPLLIFWCRNCIWTIFLIALLVVFFGFFCYGFFCQWYYDLDEVKLTVMPSGAFVRFLFLYDPDSLIQVAIDKYEGLKYGKEFLAWFDFDFHLRSAEGRKDRWLFYLDFQYQHFVFEKEWVEPPKRPSILELLMKGDILEIIRRYDEIDYYRKVHIRQKMFERRWYYYFGREYIEPWKGFFKKK